MNLIYIVFVCLNSMICLFKLLPNSIFHFASSNLRKWIKNTSHRKLLKLCKYVVFMSWTFFVITYIHYMSENLTIAIPTCRCRFRPYSQQAKVKVIAYRYTEGQVWPLQLPQKGFITFWYATILQSSWLLQRRQQLQRWQLY